MANDFSVADVLAWARTKPADEEYCYTDNGRCALAQFLVETRRAKQPSVGPNYWFDMDGDAFERVSAELDDAVDHYDQTFGALVKRLEAIVQETPAKPTPWLNPQTYLDADVGENVL